MRKLLMVVLVFCAGSMVFGGAVTPLKITKPPKLDGKLNEPFWSQAQSVRDFHVFKRDGEMTQDTEVKLACDNAWLYLGFICTNEHLKLLMPKGKGRWEGVNEDDSVEIFIDPGTLGKKYLQYKLSHAEAKGENRCSRGQGDTGQGDASWDEPWRAAVDKQTNCWSAEVAIPLYILFSESGTAPWTINVCRNKRILALDQYFVIVSERIEHSSLAKVQRSFHEPGNFAPLEIPDVEKVPTPLLAVLSDVKIHPYRMQDGMKMFDVWLAARGANAQRGELRAEVTTRPVSGATTRTVHTFTQTGTKLSKATVSVPVENFIDRDIEVALLNPALSGVMDKIVIEAPQVLSVMTAYLKRNYYTTEQDAVAAVSLSMPPEALKNMQLVVAGGGKRLAVLKKCSQENRIVFPITAFKTGSSPIRIELQQNDGIVFFAKDIGLLKRVPRPGCEWKIDHINQMVLNNGKIFFPIGMVTIRARNKEQWAETIKLYKDMGFNTILINLAARLTPALLRDYCAMAAAENMFLVIRPASVVQRLANLPEAMEEIEKLIQETGGALTQADRRGLMSAGGLTKVLHAVLRSSSLTDKQRLQCLEIAHRYNYPIMMEGVAAIKDSPSLIAYYTADEPNRRIPQYKVMDAEYDKIYEVDGYHPVMPIFAQYVHPGEEWLNAADIVCVDCYWTPEEDASYYSTPNYVAALTTLMVERCERNRKVPWIMPCAEGWSGIQRGKRTYTPAEHYCQTILGIIHGAKGIIWFADPSCESNRKALRDVAAMVTRLAPMASAVAVNQEIRYFQKSADETNGIQEVYYQPEKREFPDVQGRIFRDPANGELVLLAANSRYYPVDTEFTVAGLKNARVETLFKGTAPAVSHGMFKETLAPFAVRAYCLGVIQEPVKGAITSRRPAEIPPPAVMIEGNVRMDRKNVMPNPGFEEATVPGVPDYYSGGGELDMADAKFGRHCLKLPPYNIDLVQLIFIRAPFEKQETLYTISLWMKGEKSGEKVEMRLYNSDRFKQTFNVTPEWARYSFPVSIPARMTKRSLDAFWIIRNQTRGAGAGAVFIDGLQLERGAKATEFEE